MVGRKPLHENELERRIRETSWLKNLGYCNQAIARELCIPLKAVSFCLQGYHSEREYNESLKEKTREYERKLSELKDKIPLMGYKILEFKKTTRGLVIGLESIGFIASEIQEDFKENIDNILKECSLGERKLRFFSVGNRISITCYGINARAFVNAYAEIILSREKGDAIKK